MLYKSLCSCALVSLLISAVPHTVAGQQDPKSSQSTAQPDRTLYERGAADLQKKRFEVGRMELQTLINTYQSSEYLLKARLALAESWFKEGGARGLAQAQAECSQLIQQFPNSPEAQQAAELVRKIEEPAGKRPSPSR